MQFHFPGQTGFYKGKVRDVYFLEQDKLIILTSDRISAFDCILPATIPGKGQILNEIAAFMLQLTADICPNWLEATPAPNASAGKLCTPYKIEMVVRGNLTGHAWRCYRKGERTICGVSLPAGLKEYDELPEPVITPTTKADKGHDRDISREDILQQGLVDKIEYEQLERYARAIFSRGSAYAASKGLVLADAKYEFGKLDGKIYLIDEVHTPDSARYFYRSDLTSPPPSGVRHLSKEFVRSWLIAQGFTGMQGQVMPPVTDEQIANIRAVYVAVYEKLLSRPFVAASMSAAETEQHILDYLRRR